MNRRDLFKILTGIGLGAVAIETYERLYHIPMLETMFRKELEYWINQYNIAREEVEKLTEQLRKQEDEISGLRGELAKSKEELEHLIQQYNTTKEEVSRLSEMLKQSVEEINSLKEKVGYWEARYNTTREEVGRLNSTINKIDELERESTSAIEYYRGRMDEAIRKLKETIEKYRVLLGDERVSFESSTVKILEDLKLTQEKLQKVLPYFPLILKFYWKPTKVINDKIYDINVSFEVISPLNSLKEVEVILIPVEYRYFITKYGMREEDYDKVFPKEEVRSVKIKPRNLEREMFSVDFEDLKGGREYIVKARVEDVAGNEKIVEAKTPYIRQFENLGKELYDKGIIVAATYYPLYPDPHLWEWLKPMDVHPLLGEYDVRDTIIQAKHIDWFTGHGGNCFFISWGSDDFATRKIHENTLSLLSNPLSNQVKVAIFYELPSRLRANGVYPDKNGIYYLDSPEKWSKIVSDMNILKKEVFWRENYLKLGNKRVIYFYNSDALEGNLSEFLLDVRNVAGSILIISQHAHPWAATSAYINPPSGGWIEDCISSGSCEYFERAKLFDGWSTWAGGWYSPVEKPLNENYPKFLEEGYKTWSKLAKEYKKILITSILPGFVNLRDPDFPTLPRDVEMFKKMLLVSLKYAVSNEDIKIVRIDTYNEFGEATGIEPTVEEGFSYLLVLREVLLQKYL
jgi:archaellum component FlaC